MPTRLATLGDLRCPDCGKRFRACVTESNGWKATCPDGHTFDANPGEHAADSGKTADYNNRQFIGTQADSVSQGFHPSEVREARELLGGEAANCIKDDGSVQFSDRAQERRYRQRYAAVQHSNEQRVDEARHNAGMDPLER